MEKTQSLLIARSIPITDFLSVYIPTVGEILSSDDREYYQMVTTLTSSPYDLMVQLDDMGIDYEQITDFELFMLLFQSLQNKDLSLIFPDLDASPLKPAKNNENGQIVLWDAENGIVIDELIYNEICDALRKIHFTEKPKYKAGNKEAKKFLIERTRLKQKRQGQKALPFLFGRLGGGHGQHRGIQIRLPADHGSDYLPVQRQCASDPAKNQLRPCYERLLLRYG